MGRLTQVNRMNSDEEAGALSGLEHYLSTHPAPEERIQTILDYKEAH